MKQIDISTKTYPRTFALVDDSDYAAIVDDKWHPQKGKGVLRAYRNIRIDGSVKRLSMHRVIMGLEFGDPRMVDHRDGNGLNNQKENLRICNNSENMMNRGPQKNNKSGYKGVSWVAGKNRWVSRLEVKGKVKFFGNYFCLIKAAKAYDVGAVKYHGTFAKLNFPDE